VRVGATTTASPTHELFSTSTDPLPPESTDALDVGGGVEAGTELPAEEKVSLEALPLAAVGGAASESTDASPGTPLVWWVAGLVALIGVTASVLVLARREQVEVIEGFVVEGDD
jgi:hypothetical protein